MVIIPSKRVYTTGPVYERPVSVKNSVSEGHPAGFTRDRYERKNGNWDTNPIARYEIWDTRQFSR